MSLTIRSIEHGEYGYARRTNCKCDLCVHTVRDYGKRRQYDADRGRPRLADATQVREHVLTLRAQGASHMQIGVAAGIEANQIVRIEDGRTQKVYRDTVPKIMAVTLASAQQAAQTLVPPLGLRRRIEALRWMGWGHAELAKDLGITLPAVNRWAKRDRVMSGTVEMVDELYQRLHMTVGPNTRQRWIAYRADFLPPMAWDDETIDDPNARPHPTRCIVEQCGRVAFRVNLCANHFKLVGIKGVDATKWRWRVERLGNRLVHTGAYDSTSDIAELKALGLNMHEVARRTGKSPKTIEKMWSKVA